MENTVQRAVLFLNGDMPSTTAARHRLHPDDVLVAVDGGLQHLTALGLQPKVLIGDLDSITTEEVHRLEKAGCTVLKFAVEKDETDFELALDWAVRQGFSEILVLGALGGRLDQTLANLFLLGWERLAGCQVSLVSEDTIVQVIRHQAEITGSPGDTISLLPLHGPVHGISTRGLKYPLHGETLFPERSRGVSNVMTGERVHISLDEGLLLCIHTHSSIHKE